MCMGRIRRTHLLYVTTFITCTMVFFLEMGALDGVWGSNTMFFEKERSWRGLLIEPNTQVRRMEEKKDKAPMENPTRYIHSGLAHVQEFDKIPASRPNSVSVNAAICDERRTVHFVGRKSNGQESSSE